jgi:sulfonate transport system permease protein
MSLLEFHIHIALFDNGISGMLQNKPTANTAVIPAIRFTAPKAPYKKQFKKIIPWILPALLLLAWQLIADLQLLPVQYIRNLSSPVAVIHAGWELTVSGELWQNFSISALRAVTGLVIGGGLGLVFGIATGYSPILRSSLDNTFQMLRTIPHLALIPLVILWFGIDEGAKVFLVALGVFFPIYLNTFHGINNFDRALIEMSKSYGMSGWRLFKEVILPGALPDILVGVRFSLGIMWLTLIVAETISSTSGIGYLAMNAREFSQTDIIIFSILFYALLGFVADYVAKQLERRLLRWNPIYNNQEH